MAQLMGGAMVASVLAVTACAGTTSPSPTAVGSPSAIATPNPSPDANLTVATPTPSATPEIQFDASSFAEIKVGESEAYVGYATGMLSDGCTVDGPFRYFDPPGPAAESPWVLWVVTAQDGADAGSRTIDAFGLEAGYGADLTQPFGPQGPGGVQLGMTETDVLDTFPDALVMEYLDAYYNETYQLYVVDSMVVATRSGAVVDIRWGSSEVAHEWHHQRCNEGDAPFNWEDP